MFRPTRHTNLQVAPITVGASILGAIEAQGSLSFSSLDNIVRDVCGNISQRRLQEVLIFLYALGALDFSDDLDAFVPGMVQGTNR